MLESKRIIINTLCTYGQSLLGMVLVLFSTRWLLVALGHEDYGIFGVVGSAILLMRILTAGLNVGITRFYAFSIGGGRSKEPEEAHEDLMRWFNAALAIHVAMLVLIALIGLPLGEYAIKKWLTIPDNRLDASIWVFRFSIVTALVSFFAAPFVSMLTAYQRIYVVSAADVLRSLGVCLIAFTMLHISGDRLIAYAFAMTCLGLLIQGMLIVSAIRSFPACRVRLAYLHEWGRLRKLFSFTGWKLFGKGSLVLREQGTPIVINLYFGPLANAAYTVANSLFNKANVLSSALNRAFQPAVVSAEGSGDRQNMLSMAMRVCKFGTLLVMLFVVPAILEMENLLNLWLVDPPEYAAKLCQWLLALLIVDRLTSGHALAINAFGKIAAFEVVQGMALFSAVPFSAALFFLGFDLSSIGGVFLITTTLYCITRVVFAKKMVDFPVLSWIRKVGLPVLFLLLAGTGVGGIIIFYIEDSAMRILLTFFCVVLTVTIGAWACLLDREEKFWIKSNAQNARRKYLSIGS